MQETTINLRETFYVIVRRIYIIILCIAIGGGVAYALAEFVISPRYTSSISLYVNNNTTELQGTGAVNINDINASQKLVNTYIVILQDDEVLEQVARRLLEEFDEYWIDEWLSLTKTGTGMDTEGLRKSIRMSSVNNTEVLRIDVETKNEILSARICTIMAETAPNVLMRVVKAGSVEVIGSAKVAEKPSSPNVLNYSVIGALAGAVLSVMSVMAAYVLDNTVNDEEGIKKRYNIPILGEIPDFSARQKGGQYRYGS